MDKKRSFLVENGYVKGYFDADHRCCLWFLQALKENKMNAFKQGLILVVVGDHLRILVYLPGIIV